MTTRYYTAHDLDGTPIHGVMTDEHSASSYGLPVFVLADGYSRDGRDISGTVFGCAELRDVSLSVAEAMLSDAEKDAADAWVRRAGYRVVP